MPNTSEAGVDGGEGDRRARGYRGSTVSPEVVFLNCGYRYAGGVLVWAKVGRC